MTHKNNTVQQKQDTIRLDNARYFSIRQDKASHNKAIQDIARQ